MRRQRAQVVVRLRLWTTLQAPHSVSLAAASGWLVDAWCTVGKPASRQRCSLQGIQALRVVEVIGQWPPLEHVSIDLPKCLRWNCLQAVHITTSASGFVGVSVRHTAQARTKRTPSEELQGAVWDVMERVYAWVCGGKEEGGGWVWLWVGG